MVLKKYILAIDAGFRHTGIAVWDGSQRRFVYTKVVSVPPQEDRYVLQDTLRVVRIICAQVSAVLSRFPAKVVVAELPVGSSRNSRAAFCMGVASATFIALFHQLGVRLVTVRPLETKQWVGGQGRKSISKTAVIDKVSRLCGSSLLPDSSTKEHVADAMAALLVAFEKGYL